MLETMCIYTNAATKGTQSKQPKPVMFDSEADLVLKEIRLDALGSKKKEVSLEACRPTKSW